MSKRNDDQPPGPDEDGRQPVDYDVGYKNPPKHTRFKKGTSGNKSGLAKYIEKEPNAVMKVLMRPILMTEGGITKRVPAYEAVHQKRLELALKGNMKAISAITEDAKAAGFLIDWRQISGPSPDADRMYILTDAELDEYIRLNRKLLNAPSRPKPKTDEK